jgi:hypothetical protein
VIEEEWKGEEREVFDFDTQSINDELFRMLILVASDARPAIM